ncbi:pseudouridine synthase PUS6 SCDLUD_004533 [Saccharomycodes ludwigii]|uniref:pseudouridine synthase PUS6 n=1 Tax=Saccharomycodes ludwigii TaxID=36035 RepID=UPI001E81C9CA|nr:hypothetical protein SCDLUD_004533 [Saccharomycodes ludwigii]KAH3899107.1 hypothetical protein SCDLUD_004533 [Saccharomycodes ludwigii]
MSSPATSSFEVIFHNGLRKIKPYYDSRKTFVKGRWFGKTLLQILTDEFKYNTKEQHLESIKKGNFTLLRPKNKDYITKTTNYKSSGIENDPSYEKLGFEQLLATTVENKDILLSVLHKHEPPILQWCREELTTNNEHDQKKLICGIEVVYEDEEILVINKPSGIPIHPTSNFYQNTLVQLLYNEVGIEFCPCYRLDKITSGLLILGKNGKIANKIQQRIRARNMNKIYFARVRGRFPGKPLIEMAHNNAEKKEIQDDIFNKLFMDEKTFDIIKKTTPIYSIDPKKQYPAGLGVPKNAETWFQFYKYLPEQNQSIVICKPLTGRTHQIRIHLSRIGHPIVGDPFYDPVTATYPKRLNFFLNHEDWTKDLILEEGRKQIFEELMQEFKDVQEIRGKEDKYCEECGGLIMCDPPKRELSLYLHAFKYYSDDGLYNYQTSPPEWID